VEGTAFLAKFATSLRLNARVYELDNGRTVLPLLAISRKDWRLDKAFTTMSNGGAMMHLGNARWHYEGLIRFVPPRGLKPAAHA